MSLKRICAFVITLAPSALAAPDKKACGASYEQAQLLHQQGKYTLARAELAVCTDASCPSWIKTDCLKWLADIEQNQPTIVIVAKDARGNDVSDTKVIIDDAVAAEHNSGAPVKVDLGEHRVRLVRADASGNEQTSDGSFVARAGDKNREVVVTFGSAAPAPAPVIQTSERRASAVPAIVVGAAGLAAIGASIVIGAIAKSDIDSMRSTCAPRCAQSDVDAANAKVVVSDVLTVAGLVGVAAGVVMFLLRPKIVDSTASVAIAPVFKGGSTSFALRF